jgi:hypothetical protein
LVKCPFASCPAEKGRNRTAAAGLFRAVLIVNASTDIHVSWCGIRSATQRLAYSVAADGRRFLVDMQLNTAEQTLNVIPSWEKAVSVKER